MLSSTFFPVAHPQRTASRSTPAIVVLRPLTSCTKFTRSTSFDCFEDHLSHCLHRRYFSPCVSPVTGNHFQDKCVPTFFDIAEDFIHSVCMVEVALKVAAYSPAGTTWRKTTTVPTSLSVGLALSQIWASSSHAALAAISVGNLPLSRKFKNHAAVPELLASTSTPMTASCTSPLLFDLDRPACRSTARSRPCQTVDSDTVVGTPFAAWTHSAAMLLDHP